jgi:hypothetical protein
MRNKRVIITLWDHEYDQEPKMLELKLSGLYAECFNPLPRDRELFPDSHERACKQEEERRRVAKDICIQLTHALLELIQKSDTENGYKIGDTE